jgi:hypothetical protein
MKDHRCKRFIISDRPFLIPHSPRHTGDLNLYDEYEAYECIGCGKRMGWLPFYAKIVQVEEQNANL